MKHLTAFLNVYNLSYSAVEHQFCCSTSSNSVWLQKLYRKKKKKKKKKKETCKTMNQQFQKFVCLLYLPEYEMKMLS